MAPLTFKPTVAAATTSTIRTLSAAEPAAETPAQRKAAIEHLDQFLGTQGPGRGAAIHELELAAARTPGAPYLDIRTSHADQTVTVIAEGGRNADWLELDGSASWAFSNPEPGHYRLSYTPASDAVFDDRHPNYTEYLDFKIGADGKLDSMGMKTLPHLFFNSPDFKWSR